MEANKSPTDILEGKINSFWEIQNRDFKKNDEDTKNQQIEEFQTEVDNLLSEELGMIPENTNKDLSRLEKARLLRLKGTLYDVNTEYSAEAEGILQKSVRSILI